jgi:hypothetical protein
LTVFYSFSDVVDSRFPEQVDNLLESLTPLLKLPLFTKGLRFYPNYQNNSQKINLYDKKMTYDGCLSQISG